MTIKKEILNLLREDPEFRAELKSILLGNVATKEDIKTILQQIQALREDFQQQNKQIQALREDFQQTSTSILQEIADLRKDLSDKVSALGSRWGLFAKETIKNTLREFFEEKFNVSISSWETYDKQGIVFNHPSLVEIDIVVRNDEHMLIECKSNSKKSDIAELTRIGNLYQQKEGAKPHLYLITTFIDEKALKLAHKLNVTVLKPD